MAVVDKKFLTFYSLQVKQGQIAPSGLQSNLVDWIANYFGWIWIELTIQENRIEKLPEQGLPDFFKNSKIVAHLGLYFTK